MGVDVINKGRDSKSGVCRFAVPFDDIRPEQGRAVADGA